MTPLAERMRPLKPKDFFGQQHLMGEGAALRMTLERGNIHSCIFWGPPGVGKTSLAMLIAAFTGRRIISLSAINAGVKDVRSAIDDAGRRDIFQTESPILFIDEIHRFNKSQQDALLEAVEKGTIILIGATTENPSFEVNQALLSRCQVYVLEELTAEELKAMADAALVRDDLLSKNQIVIEEYEALIYYSGGDARKLYNILEIIVSMHSSEEELRINNQLIEESIKVKNIAYDKGGEMHYDIVSAFIKSMRGSDPNAALYWMARMLLGGEDPMFISRRMVILAAEDIGLANPNALLLAQSTMAAVHSIGMPECRIVMAECAIYLACSPKSNTAYMAIKHAYNAVEKHGNLSVPLHLRNAPTKLMSSLNYGKDYQYAHDFENNFADISYLPKEIDDIIFYEPGHNQSESKFKTFLASRWTEKYGK